MVSRMTEKLRFLPVDLQVHRSQVFDLMVEYNEWMFKEIKEQFKIDILRFRGISSVREYVTTNIDKTYSLASSGGIFYLVESEGAIIGMGALHQISERKGAIRRMYIQPAYRGKGYGRILLQQLLEKAKEFGYDTIYLDTGQFMVAAQHLYHSFGFAECKEYPETEIQLPPQAKSHWLCMKRTLGNTTKSSHLSV
jgi:N-acetylglutamate synthase-like GNAT family acetyltransferase